MRLRVVIGIVVASLLSSACTGDSQGDASASASPAPTITTSNAADLQQAWSVNAALANFQAEGHELFAIVRPGVLEAFPEGCEPSGGTCPPDWTARFRSGSGPGDHLYDVVDGVVYVSSSNGGLFAYPADCGAGGAECEPTWTAQIAAPDLFRSLAVSGGVVFAGATDGYVRAFPTDCTGRCDPTWIGDVVGSAWRDKANYPRFSVAVSADGGVVAATTGFFTFEGTTCAGDACHLHGILATFAADCASDGGTCDPRWTYAAPTLSGAAPVVSDGVVLVQDAGVLAFPAECADPCSPVWTIPAGSARTPVVSDAVVYITGTCKDIGSDSGDACKGPRIAAYPLHCVPSGGTCAPIWTGPGEGNPVVAEGVVVVVGGGWHAYPNDGVYPVGCGADGAECEPRPAPPGMAAVRNGLLYVVTPVREPVMGDVESGVQVLDLECVMGQPDCEPLWVGPTGTWGSLDVTDTALYTQDPNTRAVSAFTVPGSAVGSPAGA